MNDLNLPARRPLRVLLYERTQAHAATQMHAQDVAQQNNFDATERRVTDLYCRAVEQIGHANAAVRLAIEGSTAGRRFTKGFWGQVRVDLNGAALYGFDFSECQLGGR